MEHLEPQSNFIFYADEKGNTSINVVVENDTVWVTQASMSEVFGVKVPAISKHLKNIFEEGELEENSVLSKMETTASDGKSYMTSYYNLDAIISVGYRVNSTKATQFRIWATNVLKEYLVKGFAMDDERLKQGKTLFGKDYFDELLERIREIRASERRFYQKITDIYATSVDYNAMSPTTRTFFATVQNKLEFAITHLTAPEIIKGRADSKAPRMGLTSWKNQKTDGKILKSDVSIAKNYLSEAEISELNTLVNMYLDFAELQAKRKKLMNMADWVERLDSFLTFNEYDLLKDSGKISADLAKKFAEKEYSTFRIVQDKEYKSDFDKVIEDIRSTGKIPEEIKPFPKPSANVERVSALSLSSIRKKRELGNKNRDSE